MYAISYNLEELKENNIKEILSGDRIESETTPDIIKYLVEMNKEGFLTFESQPAETIYEYINNKYDYNWIKRAYINGFYPDEKIAFLNQQLKKLNPNIIISETFLSAKGEKYDELLLWNFDNNIDRRHLIHGLYPMAMTYDSNKEIKYFSSYSGNVTKPASRGDYVENFTNELLEDIYDKGMSLIQIWSRNIEDDIFPIVLAALVKVNKILS